MLIRPLEHDDVEAVVALWQACELTRPWNDPYRDIQMSAGKETSEVLVGVVDGRVVASAMVGFDGHRGLVYYLSVSPDLQGQGYGSEIMQAAEAWLIERGARKILLFVRESNLGVIEFYEKIGFKKDPTVLLGKFVATDGPKPP